MFSASFLSRVYRAAETKYININMNVVCSETKNPSVSLTRRMLSYCVRRRVHPPIREISPIILLVFILIIFILMKTLQELQMLSSVQNFHKVTFIMVNDHRSCIVVEWSQKIQFLELL